MAAPSLRAPRPTAAEYLEQHLQAIQGAVAGAVRCAVAQRAPEPLRFIAAVLVAAADEAADPARGLSSFGREPGECLAATMLDRIDASCKVDIGAVAPDRRALRKNRSLLVLGDRQLDARESLLWKVYDQLLGLDGGGTSIGYEGWVDVLRGRLQTGLGSAEIDRVWDRLTRRGLEDETPLQGRGLDFDQFVQGADEMPFLRGIVKQMQTCAEYRFKVPDKFDYDRDTSSNYRVAAAVPEGGDGAELFFGDYADIRATRDHAYHGVYSRERQLWQDVVVKASVSCTAPQPNPWVVFTMGAMGVGKGHALSWMSQHGFFPLENIVHIDPDHYKNSMPEWDAYVKLGKAAGSMCHLESGYIQEIAQEVAMRSSQNVWVDGSLRNGPWAAKCFQEIRAAYPQYRIAIFVVTAPEEVVLERVNKRACETGRDVPYDLVKQSLEAVAINLDILTPLCNFVARISNALQPHLLAFERIDISADWDLIKRQFAQSHDDGQAFPSSLAPFILDTVPRAFLEPDGQPPLLQGSSSGGMRRVRTDLARAARLVECTAHQLAFLEELGERELILSPTHPVNLGDEARERAGIPAAALTFAFVYPSTSDLLDAARRLVLDKKHVGELQIAKLLILGGFVYFDSQQRVCHVSCISQVGLQILTKTQVRLLQFGPRARLPAEAVAALGDRLRWVTVPKMREKGARYFAWIKPGEQLGCASWEPPPFGGFAFLFRDRKDGEGHDTDCCFPVIST